MGTPDWVRFVPASDQSLLVVVGNEISPEAHQRVRRMLHVLQDQKVPQILNLHPAYCSLLIRFDPLAIDHAELEATLRPHLERLDGISLPEPREVEIPVCYGGEFGADLAELAEMHGMTPAEAVEAHSSAVYTAYFLGFTPGFAYLGGLPDVLATPRLPTPRRSVPAGSVGIAGNQTGVYPFSTAGGWKLIGRTPLRLFRPGDHATSLLAIGDRVRFHPITPDEFGRQAEACR